MEEVIEEINLYQFDGEINFDIQFIESGLHLLTEELDENIFSKLEAIMYLTESFKILNYLDRIDHHYSGCVELCRSLEVRDGIFFTYMHPRLTTAWRIIGFFISSKGGDTYERIYRDLLSDLDSEGISEVFTFACAMDFIGDTYFYDILINEYEIDPSYEDYLFIGRLLIRDNKSILESILLKLDVSNITTGRDLMSLTEDPESLAVLERYGIRTSSERRMSGKKRSWEEMLKL